MKKNNYYKIVMATNMYPRTTKQQQKVHLYMYLHYIYIEK